MRRHSTVVVLCILSLFASIAVAANPKSVEVVNEPGVHVLSEPEEPRQVEIVAPHPLPVTILPGDGSTSRLETLVEPLVMAPGDTVNVVLEVGSFRQVAFLGVATLVTSTGPIFVSAFASAPGTSPLEADGIPKSQPIRCFLRTNGMGPCRYVNGGGFGPFPVEGPYLVVRVENNLIQETTVTLEVFLTQ